MNPCKTSSAAIRREQTPDDTALVIAAKAGNEEAFTKLIIRHRGRILAVVKRITNNHADAEDVFQTTSLQVFVHICRFDCRSKFSTWVTRIAINTALMLLRRHRAVVTASLEHVMEVDPSRLREPRSSRLNRQAPVIHT